MGRCSDARDRLLATASRLLHERGYTAVSVNDICAEAGLKKGSFYHFFRSKHALVLAALDHFAERQETGMREAVAGQRSAREQLVETFVDTYRTYQAAQRSMGCAHGCLIGNLAQEMAHRDAELRTKLGAIFARWEGQLAALLRSAKARGELAVHDPDRAAEALMAYLQGTMLLAKASDDPEVFLRLAHGMVALAEADLPTATVSGEESAPHEGEASKSDESCQVSGAVS